MTAWLRGTRGSLLLLLTLLSAFGYELAAEQGRVLWLLGCLAAMVGLFLPTARAALIGWVLMAPLLAYLMVSSWLGQISGTGWLILFVLPWLPLMAATVNAQVGGLLSELHLAQGMTDAALTLHPASGLPGLGFARLTYPHLYQANRRHGHRTGALLLEITNIELVRELSDAAEYRHTHQQVAAELRTTLRASDWVFHLDEARLLILADLGPTAANGAEILLTRALSALRRVPRLEVHGQAVTALDAEESLSGVLRRLMEVNRTAPELSQRASG